jgi:hypothetical protein
MNRNNSVCFSLFSASLREGCFFKACPSALILIVTRIGRRAASATTTAAIFFVRFPEERLHQIGCGQADNDNYNDGLHINSFFLTSEL